MFEGIRKRGGQVVEFDSSKITSAITKAGKATGEFGEREARKLTLRVLTLAHDLRLDSVPEVEEIQDIVERVLLDSPFYKTAKAYILYREQHAQIRSIAAKASVDLVENYLQGLDWKIKENSNMCYSLQGLNNYISSDITSEYWLCFRSIALAGISKTCSCRASRAWREKWKVPRPSISGRPSVRLSTSSIPCRVKQQGPRPFPTLIPSWPLSCALTT
jgi:hypothetical protein